ncbi:MAG: hypothetical protein WCD66_04185 [Rhodanobacteraceae bacterium]
MPTKSQFIEPVRVPLRRRSRVPLLDWKGLWRALAAHQHPAGRLTSHRANASRRNLRKAAGDLGSRPVLF